MSDTPEPKAEPVAPAEADANPKETTAHQTHKPNDLPGFVEMLRLGLTLLCSPCLCSHPVARHEPLSANFPAMGFGPCKHKGCACTHYLCFPPTPRKLETP